MVKSNIKAIFKSDIAKVWETVTDNKNYAWRSDLSKIEILNDGKKFVEYTKDGSPTMFTVTRKEPCSRYEFDIENKNMRGQWIGIFTETADGTVIDFTEEVTVKNPFMKLLAGLYLKKQQRNYVNDLKKELGETV